MNLQDFAQLQRVLVHATWTADHNPLLDLPREQLLTRLGAIPPEGVAHFQVREKLAITNLQNILHFPPNLLFSVDWRSHNGHNYVSPVKDQGGCGSCVSFGTSACIDAMMRISTNAPIGSFLGLGMSDVSEAQLYYCSKTASDTHNCASGWWPDPALAYAHNTGLAPESCFPYTAGDQSCQLCPDWQGKLTKVGGTTKLTTIAAMQNWIATKGPLITCFSVYNDFFAYKQGVYTHVSGAFDGGHCVCVIGYSLTLKAWLCKNSWGATWGSGGYFWIAFGQCGVDAEMWGINDFTTVYNPGTHIIKQPVHLDPNILKKPTP